MLLAHSIMTCFGFDSIHIIILKNLTCATIMLSTVHYLMNMHMVLTLYRLTASHEMGMYETLIEMYMSNISNSNTGENNQSQGT